MFLESIEQWNRETLGVVYSGLFGNDNQSQRLMNRTLNTMSAKTQIDKLLTGKIVIVLIKSRCSIKYTRSHKSCTHLAK